MSRRASTPCRRIMTARWRRCSTARALLRGSAHSRRRRESNQYSEVLTADRGKRPSTFFRISTSSQAATYTCPRYDTQVEVLFSGQRMPRDAGFTAAPRGLRRTRSASAETSSSLRHGRFLDFVKQPGPTAASASICRSLREEAKQQLKRWSWSTSSSEWESFPCRQQPDAVTSIFCPELPPNVRRMSSAIALLPARLVLVIASARDEPAYDGLLELFPQIIHEPYYTVISETSQSELSYPARDIKLFSNDCL